VLTAAVTFRMVVFRPFKGEILQATIGKINKDGIQRALTRPVDYPLTNVAVHIDFFENIWVPRSGLFAEAEL
jgi:DNA-directed RNA polymerase subunit E'/Rpb7